MTKRSKNHKATSRCVLPSGIPSGSERNVPNCARAWGGQPAAKALAIFYSFLRFRQVSSLIFKALLLKVRFFGLK